jgi:hypothetical protein
MLSTKSTFAIFSRKQWVGGFGPIHQFSQN